MKALGPNHLMDCFLYACLMLKTNFHLNIAKSLWVMLYFMYYTLSAFLLDENIGGVMETTVERLITVAQLPLRNKLGGSSSLSVVTLAETELSAFNMYIYTLLFAFSSLSLHIHYRLNLLLF